MRDLSYECSQQDLQDKIDELDESGVVSPAEEEEKIREMGIDVYSESSRWRIYEVTTPEAASFMARNTKWCTSDPHWAEQYLEDGPLYVVFRKVGNKLEKYMQYSADYSQVMDVTDRPIEDIPPDLAELMSPVI